MIRLFDAHADTAYELWIKKEPFQKNSCHIDGEKASAYSQYEQIFAICSLAGSKWELTEAQFRECFDYFFKLMEGERSVKAHYSIEGAELIGCDPERLEQLAHQGFVTSTLTWNADNALAGWHRSELGLTDQGKAYVRAAEECGILIDVSHLSEAAFWQLADMAQNPIVASHSNCSALWKHSRNLTDDQLRAIGESGGIVGLNLYTDFLGENADFSLMRHHLEHMMLLCGTEHVCLGGDLDGCECLPEGFSDLSGYGKFYQYLQSCGYEASLLDRIFYRNLYELLERRR